ncbi:MAG: acyl-CoA thioesterase [Clostridia bacterium]|nr:acyl-CoA thioesterase [Clostridia bacterium]
MFRFNRKAQYHETDQMGVIHHANYIKWMEEARVAFLDTLGCGYAEIEREGLVSPVVGISIDYRRPTMFSDEVEIGVRINRYSTRMMEIGYEIKNLTRGTLAAEGVSKHCFLKDGAVVSLKTALPKLDALLSAYMDSEENRTE